VVINNECIICALERSDHTLISPRVMSGTGYDTASEDVRLRRSGPVDAVRNATTAEVSFRRWGRRALYTADAGFGPVPNARYRVPVVTSNSGLVRPYGSRSLRWTSLTAVRTSRKPVSSASMVALTNSAWAS
jgi:hypothetical protein